MDADALKVAAEAVTAAYAALDNESMSEVAEKAPELATAIGALRVALGESES